MKMKAHLRSGLRIAIAVAIALLTVVSPLCAPLCAASACASGNSAADSGSDGCHHASASTADGSGAIAAPQLCNLKELPTATLREVRSAMEQHAKRIPSLQACATPADQSPVSQLSPSLWLPSFAISRDLPLAPTVLRI
jgi:hypothetical protein